MHAGDERVTRDRGEKRVGEPPLELINRTPETSLAIFALHGPQA